MLIISIAAFNNRCSDIAGVYLLGPQFRLAQTRPVTLAVCVNNLIFFMPSTSKGANWFGPVRLSVRPSIHYAYRWL